jgi:hypothetical protein
MSIKYEVYKYNNEILGENTLNYVVYSHSSFLDILEIQTDFLQGKGNLTLFIDKNNLDINLYERYNKVIFYDSSLPYGEKLLNCVSQIDYSYFIFLHDNDILLYSNNQVLSNFISIMEKNNFDRIDFQLSYDFYDTFKPDTEDLFLVKTTCPFTIEFKSRYLYNVNPSIWKREVLIDILEKFKHKDYRYIEDEETQVYCKKFNILKLFSKKIYRCGYFTCLEPFRYLHLTHSRELFSPYNLPEEDSKDIIDDYKIILKKYNLQRWIN